VGDNIIFEIAVNDVQIIGQIAYYKRGAWMLQVQNVLNGNLTNTVTEQKLFSR